MTNRGGKKQSPKKTSPLLPKEELRHPAETAYTDVASQDGVVRHLQQPATHNVLRGSPHAETSNQLQKLSLPRWRWPGNHKTETKPHRTRHYILHPANSIPSPQLLSQRPRRIAWCRHQQRQIHLQDGAGFRAAGYSPRHQGIPTRPPLGPQEQLIPPKKGLPSKQAQVPPQTKHNNWRQQKYQHAEPS